MKLNETRLAVAAELEKKLDTLRTAARLVYPIADTPTELHSIIRKNPTRAAQLAANMSALLELMQRDFLECTDLAGDLVESLRTGAPCVLIPEQPPTTSGEV